MEEICSSPSCPHPSPFLQTAGSGIVLVWSHPGSCKKPRCALCRTCSGLILYTNFLSLPLFHQYLSFLDILRAHLYAKNLPRLLPILLTGFDFCMRVSHNRDIISPSLSCTICDVQERLQASVAIIREAHGCFVKGAEELVKCGGQAMSLYLEPKNTQVCV